MINKGIGIFFAIFALLLFSSLSIAQHAPPRIANAQIAYHDGILAITNNTQQSISLQNAVLEFYSADKISEIIGADKNIKLETTINVNNFSQQPNSQGNLYTVSINKINVVNLLPNQTVKLKLTHTGNAVPHGFQLSVQDRVPVQVKITYANANWVETISVCNNSGADIPLKDVEFDFNYDTTMSSSIWGSPWVGWHLGSQQGTQVVLLGGTDWTPPLTSDPNCQHPLTIQFDAAPTNPAPRGPFVFKSAGAVPAGAGSLTITMPAQPANGVTSPVLTVKGVNITKQQTVNWGQVWQVPSLVPGSYTVSSTRVDNGSLFYQASPAIVTVKNGAATPASLQYQTVQMGQVLVTLNGAPNAQEPLNLMGKNYSFQKTVATNTSLNIPADTYVVTSPEAGYMSVIQPNPLIVPSSSALNITYQKQQPAANAHFVGYFQTWDGDPYTTDGTKTNLANLPSYVNVVNLAFMRPDAVYVKGSLTLSGTGIEFSYDGSVLKQAVATLHQAHPGTKVLAAVGGASFTNWNNLNARAIADFVSDFGLDGVDIDFEPLSPGCALGSDQLIHCQIDSQLQSIVQSLRSLLPRPYWVTAAAWSTGAYGQDQWKGSTPDGAFTGMFLPLMRSPAAKDLDMLNVMSYDAGNTFDPLQALAAYSHYFPGPINMGVEVPPEAWGGHIYTLAQVTQLTQASITTGTQHNTPPGMMIWSIEKQPNGTPSNSNPTAQMMATNMCNNLGLSDCNKPMVTKPLKQLAKAVGN